MVSKTKSGTKTDKNVDRPKENGITKTLPVDKQQTKATTGGKHANTKHVAKEVLSWSSVAGGKISEYPLEFTKDSKYLFCCVGTTIKVYSVATGAVVKVLSESPKAGGHTATVTRAMLNPKNPMQLWSASLDGTIKLWDYNDDVLLKSFKVNAPIEKFMICPANPERAYILIQYKTPKEKIGILYQYDLSLEKLPGNHNRLRKIATIPTNSVFDVSPDGRLLAMSNRHLLLIWNVTEGVEEVPKSHIFSFPQPERITAIKFNPVRPSVAVADKIGKITLYHLPEHLSQAPVTRWLHWHFNAVYSLQFTADGAYLLSGGAEAVLVFWQLGAEGKHFIPRVGGKIASISISPDHKYYCLGLEDNSIRLVNSISQSIVQVIQGLQYAQAAKSHDPLTTGIVVEPRNHNIVLNGVPGSIQFYNAKTDRHVMALQVSPGARLTGPNEEEIKRSNVEHVAFHSNGEWMATVDMRDDKESLVEVYLKFWRWDPDTQAYVLHTRVDSPHSKAITSVTFNPSTARGKPMAITTSLDKTMKIWQLSANLSKAYQEGEEAWICRSVGMYRQYAPEAASFSGDGSILAVAFGPIITLWDPYKNSIQEVLVQPLNSSIKSLSFVGDSPYLCASTGHYFYVWNMLTCSVWWAYQLNVGHFAVDPTTSRIAIVSNQYAPHDSKIAVFDPKSAVPIAVHKMSGKCRGVAFIPDDEPSTVGAQSKLVFLGEDFNIHILSSRPNAPTKAAKTDDTDSPSGKPVELETPSNRSMLNEIYGTRQQQRAEAERQNRKRIEAAEKSRKEVQIDQDALGRQDDDESTVLDAPSHILPSVNLVFETFVQSLMELRLQDTTGKQGPESMQVDEDTLSTDNDTAMDVSPSHEPQSFILDKFTTLDAHFASISKSHEHNTTQTKEDDMSSDNSDDSEEEDPAEIEW